MKQTFATFIDASDDKIFLKTKTSAIFIVNEPPPKHADSAKRSFILKQAHHFMGIGRGQFAPSIR
jgi:hypothetical protein